jgi:2,3-bisphosphoglycerate-independent phosphoglycerate mutase
MQVQSTTALKIPHLLLILDGFGYREDAPDNAISQANCPNWRCIWAHYPHTLIRTDGLAVGLPDGQMGNSEVGHMNLGAGRVVFQELTRINLAIATGEFQHNSALLLACERTTRAATLHILALLSDGGVHSHEDHVHAFIRMAHQQGVQNIAVHAFLDGRDTAPKSAESSLKRLLSLIDELARPGGARITIASVSGRYFAMDRDQRWERTQRAWEAIVDAKSGVTAPDALTALSDAYARGESDEFVQPSVIDGAKGMRDADCVVYMNYRADRARALTQAFVDASFVGFQSARRPALSAFVSLTEYAKQLPVSAVAFPAQSMHDALPEVLAARGLTQLRIAETEKYAHVTFFFNGGVEAPYPGEARILVPSPKVATYDLQPEMSCPEVTEKLVQAIGSQQFDLIVCNLANPDMLGHTGIMAAAIKAVETVDVALGLIEAAILQVGGVLLVTADHGNLEDMWDESSGQPNTQHSMNPVPLVLIGKSANLRSGGVLADIAPTILAIMQIDKPSAMTGQSLLS